MPTPLVAVITRTKNRPLLLPRALESVRKQTFKNFVWVIVNDGGDPKPVKAIAQKAKKADVNVIQIDNPKSLGMEAASNIGCRAVNSRYIVIHDDDDTWEPAFLKKSVAFLNKCPDYAGVVTGTQQIKEKRQGNKWVTVESIPYNSWVRAIYIVDMLQKNQFPPIAFLFKRDIYEDVGGFNESLPVLGDWDFALKILQKQEIGVLPVHLANYHLRPPELQPKDEYANTVTHHVDVHAKYDALIRNDWMRRDLAQGNFGMGTLLSLGRQHNAMWTVLWTYRDTIIDAKSKEKK